MLSDFAIKILWSFVGSFLALLVIPPKTRTEAIQRGFASVIAGAVSGKTFHEWLGIPDTVENTAFALVLSAYISWWVLGVLPTFIGKYLNKN